MTARSAGIPSEARKPDRLDPVVLEGHHVRLEPLSLDHLDALSEVALDPEIWR